MPEVPSWVELGAHGMAWWRWAWSTPEAAGWSSSLIDVAAQRASLVDDLNALSSVEGLDFGALMDAEKLSDIKMIVQSVARLATGKTALLSAMSAFDQQLGFGAKNLAALRWTIKGDAAAAEAPPPAPQGGARDRLKVVGRSA